MDEIKNPYLVIRKPKNNTEMKFSFLNNNSNKIMFQSLMRDQRDFSSINLNTLEPHFNYSYYFSVRKSGKWVKSGITKIIIPEFINKDENIEYSFNKYKDSNKLIVVFSSSSSVKNIYNYYKVLKDIKCNKLFLADESFSDDKTKCSYFIGQNKNITFEKKIFNIINNIATENKINKQDIILVGSSKGGFASLYFTIKYGFSNCIVGSPTIQLGLQHKSNEFGLKVIENLAGGTSEKDIEWLDNLIVKEISKNHLSLNLYYHAGSRESRYLDQGKEFINKLNKSDYYNIDVNLGEYESHKEVINYFPKYLLDVLNDKVLYNNLND